MRLSLAAAALALAGILAPLGSGSSHVRPTGFPLIWRTVDGALVGIEQTPTVRRIHGVWELRSDKGNLKAYMSISWREPLDRKQKPALCGGLRYTSRSVLLTTGNAGNGWFGVVGSDTATAQLTITRRVAIYRATGPPDCVEASGTADGNSGTLFGFEGTFKLLNDDTLVFAPK